MARSGMGAWKKAEDVPAGSGFSVRNGACTGITRDGAGDRHGKCQGKSGVSGGHLEW